jgi:hypothetical protein
MDTRRVRPSLVRDNRSDFSNPCRRAVGCSARRDLAHPSGAKAALATREGVPRWTVRCGGSRRKIAKPDQAVVTPAPASYGLISVHEPAARRRMPLWLRRAAQAAKVAL